MRCLKSAFFHKPLVPRPWIVIPKYFRNDFWFWTVFDTMCIVLYLCSDCCNCSRSKNSQTVLSRRLLIHYFLQYLALTDFAFLLSRLQKMFSVRLFVFCVSIAFHCDAFVTTLKRQISTWWHVLWHVLSMYRFILKGTVYLFNHRTCLFKLTLDFWKKFFLKG